MKKISFLLIAFAFVSFLVTCDYNTDIPVENHQITFVKTFPGGCNNGPGPDDLKSLNLEKDTLVFVLKNDTLDVFVGLNYICCAPFTTETRISNDSVFISVNDICPAPYQSCYCKCMCYYTWNFLFSITGEKKFWIKIQLNDPREDRPSLLKEDCVDLRN